MKTRLLREIVNTDEGLVGFTTKGKIGRPLSEPKLGIINLGIHPDTKKSIQKKWYNEQIREFLEETNARYIQLGNPIKIPFGMSAKYYVLVPINEYST
jgi:hypothetical protein